MIYVAIATYHTYVYHDIIIISDIKFHDYYDMQIVSVTLYCDTYIYGATYVKLFKCHIRS